MFQPEAPKILQYEFLNDPTKIYWKDQIRPVLDTSSGLNETSLLQNFSGLLVSGQLEQMQSPSLDTKSNFEKNFVENVTHLRSEISDLHMLNQNICSLTIERHLTPNFPKRIIEREKTGFRVIEIRVNRNLSSQTDFSLAVTGMRDLHSSLKLKTLVFLADNRQNSDATQN